MNETAVSECELKNNFASWNLFVIPYLMFPSLPVLICPILNQMSCLYVTCWGLSCFLLNQRDRLRSRKTIKQSNKELICVKYPAKLKIILPSKLAFPKTFSSLQSAVNETVCRRAHSRTEYYTSEGSKSAFMELGLVCLETGSGVCATLAMSRETSSFAANLVSSETKAQPRPCAETELAA